MLRVRVMECVVVVLLVSCLPVAAQNTDLQSLQGLQFNFSNPGARSLGMGGAFLGLADDASAAETNPAGLTILRKPEISIEVRRQREQQLLPSSGTFPDIERTTSPSKVGSVSFASIVAPIGKHFTAGLYYHEPLRDKASGIVAPTYSSFTGQQLTDTPNFYLLNGGTAPVSYDECVKNAAQCLQYRIKPFLTSVRVLQQTVGVSGAWNFGKVSVGTSVRFQRFTETAVNGLLSDSFLLDSLYVQQTSPRYERDTTFAAGLKWSATERLTFGGVYKQGARYSTPTTSIPNLKDGQFDTVDVTFHVPDIYGAGVAYRAIEPLTFTADAVRVKYSNLTDRFVSIDGFPANGFKAEDALEIRLGAEYFLPMQSIRTPIAVRAGVWRDPAHSIVWRNPPDSGVDAASAIFASIYFPEEKDQIHYSAGLGISWKSLQLDAAYDTSPHRKVGSISAITRF